MQQPIYLGCAGWSLSREHWPAFPISGTHLQRYAAQLPAVEINSSFYRPHRLATYVLWAQSVPGGFRFSLKLPKHITHGLRLRDCAGALGEFLAQCSGLGEALGCLLIQLPPSLAFDPVIAQEFFSLLRTQYTGLAVLEPRHLSWLNANDLLVNYQIGRVAADPSPIEGGERPGGWQGVRYYRLHGSPRIYYSAYPTPWLNDFAQRLRVELDEGVPVWCIFDNTASGAAMENVLQLQAFLAGHTL
jgi:uncharacterized protein YecE (DUF72 family)